MTAVAQQLAEMPALITCRQLATVLRLHPRTLWRWAREGTVPHVRLGGTVRFRQAAILAWYEARLRSARI
jgi:nitrogen PTS system EIIA component